MDKQSVIHEIVALQQEMNRVVIPYALESWRELDVPLAQLKSLLIISCRGEINFGTLARDLGVTRGDVTRIIERLVEQGLVTRNPSPTDRRVVWLQATEEGRGLLANLMESHTRHMVHILEFMSIEELESLSKGLAGFIHAVEEHQKEPG